MRISAKDNMTITMLMLGQVAMQLAESNLKETMQYKTKHKESHNEWKKLKTKVKNMSKILNEIVDNMADNMDEKLATKCVSYSYKLLKRIEGDLYKDRTAHPNSSNGETKN